MSASSQSLGLAESQDLTGPEHELEDPAESWLELVKATHLLNISARKVAVARLIFKAKNSHWTDKLWDEIQQGYDSPTMGGDADEGGEYDECEEDSLQRFARTKVTARPTLSYEAVQCPYCMWVGDSCLLQFHVTQHHMSE